MKRLDLEVEGEGRERSNGGFGGTIAVGVKLDSQSRELLTWALVKVAEPGDRVVALHVLHNFGSKRNSNSFVGFVSFSICDLTHLGIWQRFWIRTGIPPFSLLLRRSSPCSPYMKDSAT